jgi:nucleoside-diphosphate-sugar epimerase
LNVLITGAGGFLGRSVVLEFVRRGHSVRAMVRPSAETGRLAWPDEVEIYRADLLSTEDLVPSFEGIDALVHLAAGVRGTAEEQYAATVVGTQRLLDAMAKSRTTRLVLASSIAVYDWSKIEGELDERSPLEPSSDLPERDGYAVAKAEQEQVARRMAEQHHWALTVLRPGFIWGRGNEECAGLGQKVGPVLLVFGPSTRLPLTHVDNCAHAFAEVLENPSAIGETFNIVDDEGPTIREHLQATGRKRLTVPIPFGPAFAGVRLVHGLLNGLLRGKKKLPGLLVPCRFEARFKPLRFSNRKLREVLGWNPPLDPAERIQRTFGPPTDRPADLVPSPLAREG